MNQHTHMPAATAARPTIDIKRDPRWAYLEWLRIEARLLQMELCPNLDPELEFAPCNTFSKRFHFPRTGSWRDLPQPSTRALQVMRAAGVAIPEGVE